MQFASLRFFTTALFVLGSLFLLPAPPRAKAEDDLAPETKALVAKLREDMKSKTVSTRTAALKAMGELGEKAKGQRRAICEGMLDPSMAVRTAAADALRKVDEPLYKLALGILIDRDDADIRAAGTLGAQAEPLTPIILAYATSLVPAVSKESVKTLDSSTQKAMRYCIQSLVAIAPEDEGVNRAVVAMLGNPSPALRALAVDHVAPLKNKKLALKGVMALAGRASEPGPVRARAVKLVPTLVDENTAPMAKKGLEALRFDKEEMVREAVASALGTLK